MHDMNIVTPRCNDKELSNFNIKIHRIVNIHRGSSEEGTRHVEISLIFENGKSSAIKRVPISKLSQMDWSEVDDRVVFTPCISPKKAARHIAHAIQSELSECPVVDVYELGHPGLYKVDGKPVFCTGGEVIRPPAGATQALELECAQMPQMRGALHRGISDRDRL